MLLESQSGQVDLQFPEDVFRLTRNGIEFIDCNTNKVLKAKSNSFTKELEKYGFAFPVRLIWGNATIKKDYDNGYLLTDQNEVLYQLKMVKGFPYVRLIGTCESGFQQLFTIEPRDYSLIGFAVSNDNAMHAVRANGELIKMELDSYDPANMTLSIAGDLTQWTITEYTATDSRYYALDPTSFALLDKAVIPDPEPQGWQKWRNRLLPLRLRFESWKSVDIFPVLNEY